PEGLPPLDGTQQGSDKRLLVVPVSPVPGQEADDADFPRAARELLDYPNVHMTLVSMYTQDAEHIPLDGMLYQPRDPTKANGVAVLRGHGAGGSFYEGVPGFMGPALAARGYTALALNRRDFGGYKGHTKFEQGLYDLRIGIDYLADGL